MSRAFKHLYGPVPSRRLGRSLGVDAIPFKTCSYDCVYCQLTSSSYYASQSVSLSTVQPLVTGVADVYDGRVAAVSYALPSLRAPPLQ